MHAHGWRPPPSETPRPSESVADAQTAIDASSPRSWTESQGRRGGEETRLVRAGHLSRATSLGLQKSELSGRYFKAVERLKASGKLLSRLVPQDVGALARRHELLQAELKTNLVVLATAHAVSEGIIRRLSGDLVRKACPQVYGASGRATAPDPKRGQPLAFSRTM